MSTCSCVLNSDIVSFLLLYYNTFLQGTFRLQLYSKLVSPYKVNILTLVVLPYRKVKWELACPATFHSVIADRFCSNTDGAHLFLEILWHEWNNWRWVIHQACVTWGQKPERNARMKKGPGWGCTHLEEISADTKSFFCVENHLICFCE